MTHYEVIELDLFNCNLFLLSTSHIDLDGVEELFGSSAGALRDEHIRRIVFL